MTRSVDDFDAEETLYLAVSILVAPQIAGQRGLRTYRVNDLVGLFYSTYGYTVSDAFIERILLDLDGLSSSMNIARSRFAETRFIINIDEIESVIVDGLDSEDVWETYRAAGVGWLQECVDTILSDYDYDTDVQTTLQAEMVSVPAANRYVSRLDNQDVFDDVIADLKRVESEVRGKNALEEDERLIALSEIAVFEASLVQPRLAQDLIERFLEFCRVRLIKIVGETIMGILQDKLKALLLLFVAAM